MITSEQEADFERQQLLALKHIYGQDLSAAKVREKAGVDLLSKRRERACLTFARKCIDNKRCKDWVGERSSPLYARILGADNRRYLEPITRTDRHFNSSINYCTTRRLLNAN